MICGNGEQCHGTGGLTAVVSQGSIYSGPSNLRPLHLTIPSILRPLISNTTLIYFQY